MLGVVLWHVPVDGKWRALVRFDGFDQYWDVEKLEIVEGDNMPKWISYARPRYTDPMDKYTICIRGRDDPERRQRGRESGDIAPHHTIEKGDVETFEEAILLLMLDEKERTFNAISVEILDKTADITSGSKFEEAIWNLTLRGELEFTMKAPILFRR